MNAGWDSFSAGELRSVASALRNGTPATPLALQRLVARGKAEWLAAELARLAAPPPATAAFLEVLAAERARVEHLSDSLELVWSGPELPGLRSRDTAAVVRELFGSAQRELLIVGYAIHQGRQLFRVLAERMDQDPDLRVRLVLDVRREHGNTSFEFEILQRFAHDFRTKQWPGERLPEVFFDPRSLLLEQERRSAMHAKCVVADYDRTLVTSANLTEAAQQRNIELGVLVRGVAFAGAVQHRFNDLMRLGLLHHLSI